MEVILFLIVGSAILVWAFISDRNKKKLEQQKTKDLGAEDKISAIYIDGLGVIPQYTQCDIYRYPDKVSINAKGNEFEIPIERISAVAVNSEAELIEKSKSVVGRAIIGTLLVPGLGTIVGGMSGIGTKKKRGVTRYYLILNYTNKSGELAAVTFSNGFFPRFDMMKFRDDLNKVLENKPKEVVQL